MSKVHYDVKLHIHFFGRKEWMIFAGSGLSWYMKRWLQVDGSCSLHVKIEVRCHGQFSRQLLFPVGCS